MNLMKFNEFLTLAEAKPSADPRETGFHTGDQVHGYLHNEYKKHEPLDPGKVHHGVVTHHTDKHATVKWENGEVTKHHQHNGRKATREPNAKMGETPYKHRSGKESALEPLTIRHNQAHIDSPRMSNADHKKHLLRAYNEHKEAMSHLNLRSNNWGKGRHGKN